MTVTFVRDLCILSFHSPFHVYIYLLLMNFVFVKACVCTYCVCGLCINQMLFIISRLSTYVYDFVPGRCYYGTSLFT